MNIFRIVHKQLFNDIKDFTDIFLCEAFYIVNIFSYYVS